MQYNIFSRLPCRYDHQLVRRFTHHWSNLDQEDKPFRAVPLVLKDLDTTRPGEDILTNYTNFMRSDHVRFWYANNEEHFASFKAVMLSDTGKVYYGY